MGFSLLFMRINANQQLEADRDGLAAFLASRGLHVVGQGSSGAIVNSSGDALTFDGSYSDLYLDPLDAAGPVSGGIDHAHLGGKELEFIFELCVAGALVIINPQGNPLYIVPQGNHEAATLPDLENTAWINSPQELLEVLRGNYQAFIDFRDRAIAQRFPGSERPSIPDESS